MFWPGCKIYESSLNQLHLPKEEVASYHQEFFLFICLRQLTFLNMAIFMAFWDQNQLFSLIFLSKLEFLPNDFSICRNFFKSLCHFCMNIQGKYWSVWTLTDIEQFEYFKGWMQNTNNTRKICHILLYHCLYYCSQRTHSGLLGNKTTVHGCCLTRILWSKKVLSGCQNQSKTQPHTSKEIEYMKCLTLYD